MHDYSITKPDGIIDTGIILGIKGNTGAKDMAGHPRGKITESLDGLRERLADYAQEGVRFWSG